MALVWALPLASMLALRPAPDEAAVLVRVRPAVVTVLAGRKLGSGFVVTPDGEVVTAYHVIAGETSASVKFPGGRRCAVIGAVRASAAKDFAILRLDRRQIAGALPSLTVARSSAPRPGDPVLTVGSPLGREQRVSRGTLAAVRVLPGAVHELQFTGDMHPGNSGGPLVNARGEVIGIDVSAVLGFDDLNYALAIGEVGPLPANGGRVRPLTDLAKAYAGSAEDLFLQGEALLRRLDPNGRMAGTGARPYTAAGRAAIAQALDLFTRAAARRPDFARALTNAAACAFVLRRPAVALECLRRAALLRPDDPLTRYYLAFAEARTGRAAQGLRRARELVSSEPSFAPGFYVLGCLELDAKRPGDAVDALREALRLDPRYVLACYQLGRAYGLAGDALRSATELEVALRIRPDFEAARVLLGAAYARQHEHLRAITAYREALALRPDDPMGHFGLAAEYMAIGDDTRAGRETAILRRLDPKLAAKLPRRQ